MATCGVGIYIVKSPNRICGRRFYKSASGRAMGHMKVGCPEWIAGGKRYPTQTRAAMIAMIVNAATARTEINGGKWSSESAG